jgi:hypothetical protein
LANVGGSGPFSTDPTCEKPDPCSDPNLANDYLVIESLFKKHSSETDPEISTEYPKLKGKADPDINQIVLDMDATDIQPDSSVFLYPISGRIPVLKIAGYRAQLRIKCCRYLYVLSTGKENLQ